MVVHPLVEVREFVRDARGRSRVAAVFDLDSTLFNVAPRTQAILRALAADSRFAAAHGDVARALSAVEVGPAEYGVREILARLGLGAVALGAASGAVRKRWRAYFFSGDHLHHDVLYPGAVEFVGELAELGAEVFYLTGRGESAMRAGTERILSAYGFPRRDGDLIMKPSERLSDEDFKADVLAGFAQDHIWFFENEPVIIASVRRLVPRVRVIFVRSAHSGAGVEPSDLPVILPDYRMGGPV